MRLLCFTIILSALLSCKQTSKNEGNDKVAISDSSGVETADAFSDSAWLAAAAGMGADSIQLIGHQLLVSGDTVAWPWPAMHQQEVRFSDDKHAVVVTPKGHTRLELHITYPSPGGGTATDTARLMLHPAFYLAAEVADDPSTGEALPMVEYAGVNGIKTYRLLISINHTGTRYARFTMFIKGGEAPAIQTNLLPQSKP